MEHEVGDKVTLVATFTDENGSLADPDEVLFRYIEPDGTLVAQEVWTAAVPGADITRVSLGVFSAFVLITKDGGEYAWHFQGTGAVQKAISSDPDTALKVKLRVFPVVP